MVNTASPELIELLANPWREAAYLRVVFGVEDVTVAPEATITSADQTEFSDVRDIISGIRVVNDYQTLERNSFILGRGGEALPVSGFKRTGLTSRALSAENRQFATNPRIIITTPNPHNVLGFTLDFDTFRNNWCDFTVSSYFGNTLLKSMQFYADGAQFVADDTFDGWNRLEFEFTRTSVPRRRLRIARMQFGITRTDEEFNASRPAKWERETPPISDKLPVEKFTWALLNFDKEFKPGQETGTQRYLMEQQPVYFEWGYPVGDSIEWVVGDHYITDGNPKFERNTVILTAHGALAYLSDEYKKGVYSPSGRSLYDLAEDVLLDAELPLNEDGSRRWRLWDGLKNYYSTAPLPRQSGRILLCIIAQCGGCVFVPNRDGNITIAPMPTIQHDTTIDYHHQTSFPGVFENPPLYSVQVGVGGYTLEEMADIATLEAVPISGVTVLSIEYGESTNISAAVTGATLVSARYYASYAELTISGNGVADVVVRGNPLIRAERIYERVYGITGEILPCDNVLCTNNATAESIVKMIGDFYAKRSIYSTSYNGHMLIDPLDRIYTENDFERRVSGLVIANTLEYGGNIRGSIKWSR